MRLAPHPPEGARLPGCRFVRHMQIAKRSGRLAQLWAGAKFGEQESEAMDRRTFLKTTAGAGAMVATGGLATPAISQNAAAKTLRFVPQANLANFDPIWGTQYVVRNASVLV